MSKTDGGPAFPTAYQHTDAMGVICADKGGMTLRDWFAGQAMAGTIASWSKEDEAAYSHFSNADKMQMFAKISYQQADAMLAARSTSQEQTGEQ